MAPPLPHPFESARLSYRAIRAADTPIFNTIASDIHGYQNSSLTNISLPGESGTKEFIAALCNESKFLLSAVIWKRHDPNLSAGEIDRLVLNSKEKIKEGVEADEDIKLIERWGTAIGEIHLSRLAPSASHHRHTEIGIDIIPAHQGKGYGREAIEWVLEYAFVKAGLHRVKIRSFAWNTGALRLYEKIGFKVEGREREAYWHEGRWWDGVELGMLEGEWRTLKEGRIREEEQGEGEK
ncbi:acyl-CoA N-acyltransferase [Paraphoma chrysanthemicola]|nr:acyl-CoA N-acyltransferase [Paraphoma chrysanthemicola]